MQTPRGAAQTSSNSCLVPGEGASPAPRHSPLLSGLGVAAGPAGPTGPLLSPVPNVLEVGSEGRRSRREAEPQPRTAQPHSPTALGNPACDRPGPGSGTAGAPGHRCRHRDALPPAVVQALLKRGSRPWEVARSGRFPKLSSSADGKHRLMGRSMNSAAGARKPIWGTGLAGHKPRPSAPPRTAHIPKMLGGGERPRPRTELLHLARCNARTLPSRAGMVGGRPLLPTSPALARSEIPISHRLLSARPRRAFGLPPGKVLRPRRAACPFRRALPALSPCRRLPKHPQPAEQPTVTHPPVPQEDFRKLGESRELPSSWRQRPRQGWEAPGETWRARPASPSSIPARLAPGHWGRARWQRGDAGSPSPASPPALGGSAHLHLPSGTSRTRSSLGRAGEVTGAEPSFRAPPA